MSTIPQPPQSPVSRPDYVPTPGFVPQPGIAGLTPPGTTLPPVTPSGPLAASNLNPADQAGAQANVDTAMAGSPTDEPARKRRGRAPSTRVAFRAEGAAKLAAVPAKYNAETNPLGYNVSKHKPLAATDFADEAVFYDWKSSEAQNRADRYATLAKQTRELGSPEKRKHAQKLLKLTEQMAAYKAEMLAAGVDPDAMLAQMIAAQKK